MHVQIKRPDLQKFLLEQVNAGTFSSPDAATEAAVEQMMEGHGQLDDETIAAISRADDEYERGQFVEWRDVRDELRKKYLGI